MKNYLEDFLAQRPEKNLEYAQVGKDQKDQNPEASPSFEPFDPSPPPHISKVVLPCVVCGGSVRWDHHGIWRCVACWPPDAFQGERLQHGQGKVY